MNGQTVISEEQIKVITFMYLSLPLFITSLYIYSQHMVVGAARDSRGILIAFSNKQSYGLFFEWMYPFTHQIYTI